MNKTNITFVALQWFQLRALTWFDTGFDNLSFCRNWGKKKDFLQVMNFNRSSGNNFLREFQLIKKEKKKTSTDRQAI